MIVSFSRLISRWSEHSPPSSSPPPPLPSPPPPPPPSHTLAFLSCTPPLTLLSVYHFLLLLLPPCPFPVTQFNSLLLFPSHPYPLPVNHSASPFPQAQRRERVQLSECSRQQDAKLAIITQGQVFSKLFYIFVILLLLSEIKQNLKEKEIKTSKCMIEIGLSPAWHTAGLSSIAKGRGRAYGSLWTCVQPSGRAWATPHTSP